MRSLYRRAVVPSALLALAGCAGGFAANRRSPGVIENNAFKPTLPPAANYGPDPTRSCPERGVFGIIQDELNDRFKGKQAPKTDGRLCAVADTLLGWPEEDNPPETVRQFLSSYFGLPLTIRQFLITTVNTGVDRQLADALEAPIASFAESAQVPRYGLVTLLKKSGGDPRRPGEGAITKAVLVMQDQLVEISPLPRKLPAGGTATLEGRAVGSIEKPKLLISGATGKLETIQGNPDKSFRAQLQCGNAGKIVVQIRGEKEGSEAVLANFPVVCGGEELAATVPMPAKEAAAAPADPAQVEKTIVDKINADRTAAGLKPLHVEPALANVARGVSEKIAKGQGVGSSELTQQLKDADVSSPVILESGVQAFDEADAYTRLTNSPEDRGNMMNPDITDVGVGAAPGAKISDKSTVVVTALFIKQLPPPDPDQIKAKLYEAIQRRRADARASTLAKDPELDQIAQTYATEMAKDKGQVSKQRVAEIEAPLYKSFATVNEMGGVKADPLDFAQEPGIVGDAKLVGVGVAIGTSPSLGKNTPYVIILMGKRHAGKAPAVTRKPVKKK
jgi:uncharacterized protein YkwD